MAVMTGAKPRARSPAPAVSPAITAVVPGNFSIHHDTPLATFSIHGTASSSAGTRASPTCSWMFVPALLELLQPGVDVVLARAHYRPHEPLAPLPALAQGGGVRSHRVVLAPHGLEELDRLLGAEPLLDQGSLSRGQLVAELAMHLPQKLGRRQQVAPLVQRANAEAHLREALLGVRGGALQGRQGRAGLARLHLHLEHAERGELVLHGDPGRRQARSPCSGLPASSPARWSRTASPTSPAGRRTLRRTAGPWHVPVQGLLE